MEEGGILSHLFCLEILLIMVSDFTAALNQVATNRGIPVESVISALEESLVAAYKRDFDYDEEDEITAKIDLDTGEMKILKEGKDITPAGFGRIAAQAASQVLLQKIRKTEFDSVVDEYREKLGRLISGTVFRSEPNLVVIDLGKVQGLLPAREQIEGETYRNGARITAVVKEVKESQRGGGAEIIVSRSDKSFIKALFAEEVPEIESGVVVIESVSRDPGSRTKIAVSSSDKNVDPVGACVGHKGVRVQSILQEIHPEKVDIIPFSGDPATYIANALSPARVAGVKIDEEEKKAEVKVPEEQQSLAIGKGGQNVRLAHLLTGWKIDIEGVEDLLKASKDIEDEQESERPTKKKSTNVASLHLDKNIEKVLKKAGITSVEKLRELDRKQLLEMEGIGSRSAEKILKALSIY